MNTTKVAKRILCVLCLICTLTLLLVACDTKDTTETASETITETETATATETEADTVKETESETIAETVTETETGIESEIETETEVETETETETQNETNTAESSVRIMYYNVYGYSKYFSTVPDRLKQQVEMISDEAPDILCVQEFDTLHRGTSKTLLRRKGYTEVPIDGEKAVTYASAGGKNCEAMFYNKDRVKLLESGGEQYPDWVTIDGKKLCSNNGYTKSTTWGVFEELATGKQFIVINTHFMWTDTSQLTVEEANLVRVNNAERMLDLITRIRSSKDAYAELPVILGGDLNCQMDKDPFILLSQSLTPAYPVAESYEKIGYYGYKGSYDTTTKEYIYEEPTASDNIIDHVFVDGKLTVKSYLPVKELRALVTSDHLPWIVEIEL